MKVERALLVPVLAALTVAGCHQVTEFENTGESRITIYSTVDLNLLGTVSLQCQGRSLVSPAAGELVVAATDGTLHSIDTETMSVDTSFSIGSSSGTGYHEAIIDISGDLYVLGPGSQVIEVDLDSSRVVDNFTPGQQPVALSPSPTEEKIYFADASGSFIGEIWTYANVNGFESSMGHQPSDLSMDPSGGRHIVAVTSSDPGYIYGIWLDLSTAARRLINTQSGSPAECVLCFGVDSVYSIGCPLWSSDSGYVMMVRGYMEPHQGGRTYLEGHPVEMCFVPEASEEGTLFVLCRTDGGGTLISALEFPYGYLSPELAATIEIEGFPRDIAVSAGGNRLAVLTSD